LKRFFQQGDRTEGDFGNEAHMLSTLAVFKHQHITQHLASWTQGNTFYMLFPCAIGNLGRLLRSRQSPEHKNDFVLWLLDQLKGIVDGLRLIHNLAPAGLGNEGFIPNPTADDERKRTGYHHDIKPENILVFADDNVGDREPQFSELCLKISDFGAARIHNVLSRSGVKKTSHKTPNLTAGDEEYGAPDFALHAETSRPYDLWSLGCVFVEVLLWAFRTSGSNLDGFASERLNDPETFAGRSAAFWHKNVRGRIALKTSVWIRLQQLRDYSQNKRVFKYIVDSTANLLTLLPAKRPDAPKICNEIDAALLQAAIDTEREDFYIDRIEEPLQFAAPPTAYDHRSRPPSIYERSIYAPDDNFLQAQGNSPRRNSLHGRRESGGSRSDEDNNVAGTPDRQTLSPLDTQNMGTGFPRSPSPSISVYDVDGQIPPQSDALVGIELHPAASPPVAWRAAPPGPEDFPRRRRSHSSGSKSL
jgi:serine/threonine protein kinase